MKQSIPLTCLAYIADNFATALGLVREEPVCPPDADYASKVASLYSTRGPITGRVAEIGPGGSDAVARELLERGATSVDLVDRFGDPKPSPVSGIRWLTGPEAAAERFFAAHPGYDAIVSCAVLEHLSDPLSALGDMARALKPGGVMVHQVDLRDHGMFLGHELTFLKVPGWIWRLMTAQRGRPNRILIDSYRRTLRDSGLAVTLYATDLVGTGEISPTPVEEIPAELIDPVIADVRRQRGSFAKPFRDMKGADLAVSGLLIVATKSGAAAN